MSLLWLLRFTNEPPLQDPSLWGSCESLEFITGLSPLGSQEVSFGLKPRACECSQMRLLRVASKTFFEKRRCWGAKRRFSVSAQKNLPRVFAPDDPVFAVFLSEPRCPGGLPCASVSLGIEAAGSGGRLCRGAGAVFVAPSFTILRSPNVRCIIRLRVAACLPIPPSPARHPPSCPQTPQPPAGLSLRFANR